MGIWREGVEERRGRGEECEAWKKSGREGRKGDEEGR